MHIIIKIYKKKFALNNNYFYYYYDGKKQKWILLDSRKYKNKINMNYGYLLVSSKSSIQSIVVNNCVTQKYIHKSLRKTCYYVIIIVSLALDE